MRPVLIASAPSSAPPTATPEQRRTLLMASAGTLLVLITFVTPLATGVRTTVALAAGPGAQAWLLSAMSVGLAAALLTAGVLADDRRPAAGVHRRSRRARRRVRSSPPWRSPPACSSPAGWSRASAAPR